MKPHPRPSLVLLLLLGLAGSISPVFATGSGNIEVAIKSSFNYRMILGGHVDVRINGEVATLRGRAEDESTKLLAAETALGHPEVHRVVNLVEVKPWLTEFSDGWMARHIRLRLLVKSEVNPETIQISVREGVATLTGTVETTSQGERTARFAGEIVGVKAVINQLVVSDAAVARRFWDGPIDDSSITSQLRHIIRQSPEVQPPSMALACHEGAIMITGIARSQAEKSRITQLAHEVRGTTTVTNWLAVPAKSIPVPVPGDPSRAGRILADAPEPG